jgi:hypothetical protein
MDARGTVDHGGAAFKRSGPVGYGAEVVDTNFPDADAVARLATDGGGDGYTVADKPADYGAADEAGGASDQDSGATRVEMSRTFGTHQVRVDSTKVSRELRSADKTNDRD